MMNKLDIKPDIDYKQEYILLVASLVNISANLQIAKENCNDTTMKLVLGKFIRQIDSVLKD